jgi:hypothetical protein
LASAAGRDAIESDFELHGLYKFIGRPAPYYQMTKWAQAFERLRWPFKHSWDAFPESHKTDLGITVIQTPGHQPDELAWYDHAEAHLYVGDSFYREGSDRMPILFSFDGNMIEWVFSMQKLAVFVRSENARLAALAEQASEEQDDGFVHVAQRVKVSCAHQTFGVDGANILAELEAFSFRVFIGKVPVVASKWQDAGELTELSEWYDTWREPDEKRTPMSITAPRRLLEDARKFFGEDAASMPRAWNEAEFENS